jgi:hypothetical protein
MSEILVRNAESSLPDTYPPLRIFETHAARFARSGVRTLIIGLVLLPILVGVPFVGQGIALLLGARRLRGYTRELSCNPAGPPKDRAEKTFFRLTGGRAKYYWVYKGWGIAASYDPPRLYIMQPGAERALDPARDVRRVERRHVAAPVEAPGSIGDALRLSIAAKQASAASGLLLHLRDPSLPVFFLRLGDDETNFWFEVVQQVMESGGA